MSTVDSQYAIGANAQELSDSVAALIALGYEPTDSPSFNGTHFIQRCDNDGGASIGDGATIAVHNSAGADSHNAVAEVAAGVLTDVKFASTIAMVDNADTVVVNNSAGSPVAGTHSAEVAAGVLTDVKLAATVAPVVNAATVAVHNSAGSVVAGTHVAEVAAGVLTDVKLAATIAPVASGLALTGVTPTGSYVTTVTFTVTAGVITAIALS
jgi:hypothetical protein